MNLEIINKPVSFDERFMREVYLVASQSRDPRTKVGAVLARDNDADPISTGFNNFPRKVLDLKYRYEDKEIKNNYVVHAEANAIYNCARKGISTLGSTLYTQGLPCHNCCKSIIQAGVKKIVIHKQWPNLINSPRWVKSAQISQIMLSEAGIVIEVYDQVLNLSGRVDGETINV